MFAIFILISKIYNIHYNIAIQTIKEILVDILKLSSKITIDSARDNDLEFGESLKSSSKIWITKN